MSIQKIVYTLTFAFGFLFLQTASAQSESDNSSDFKSRLWYGGNIGLNFYGYNGGNVFQIGVAPMVGYKIVEPLSVGPRVSILFASVKNPGFKAVG
ncbi:MAG: hypothetical protein KA165_18690, partial [Saprospiraceae bacterium]|nr:hypothetical protein [Saprospiraceae bacterium]